jgi:acetylornithine deacetylase/succinyl-diaminopimelate desuccinylase-like protein
LGFAISGAVIFHLPADHPIVQVVREVHSELVGRPLPNGPKLFIDDRNIYTAKVGIPAVTHGPDALGAHTVNEEVPVSELERIALLYAATAIGFCQGPGNSVVSG